MDNNKYQKQEDLIAFAKASKSYQVRALLRKNLSLKSREKCSICCQLAVPILLICLVGSVGVLIKTLVPSSNKVITVDPTPLLPQYNLDDGGNCYLWFMYANDPTGNAAGYAFANGTRSGMLGYVNQSYCTDENPSYTPFFQEYSDANAIDQQIFSVEQQLRELPINDGQKSKLRNDLPDAAIIFNSLKFDNLSMDYTLQIPDTKKTEYQYLLLYLRDTVIQDTITASVINIIDSAYVSFLTGGARSLNTTIQPFPYKNNVEQIKDQITNFMGTLIYPFAMSLLMPTFIFAIVLEKQEKLRELMKMMGMKIGHYWALTWFFDFIVYLTVMFLVIILGVIWDLNLFLEFKVLVVLFITWGFVQIGMAFLISTFLGRNRTITTFLLYLVVIISVFVGFAVNMNYGADSKWPAYLLIYPPFAFYRGLYLLTINCADICLTFSDISGSSEMGSIFIWLWMEILVLYAFAFYFDAVLPKQFGIRKHPLFFILDPIAYFSKRREIPENEENTSLNLKEEVEVDGEDEDVKVERKRVLTGQASNEPIVIRNLVKVYEGGKKAVDRLSFAIHENETFGLLGPNGAGKTTTISMLTGLFPPSGGSASICGFDIVKEIDKVHLVIGVCPQFDVHWPSLTVEEHLLFYARLKGVSSDQEAAAVQEVSQRVGLKNDLKKESQALSGGMKRRLSVAMALIGNPSIVFLDEPSSGLDPTSRRHLWEVIDHYKKGRSIILTTHSMEEADTLCTRIGIIAKGKLQCVGSPVHLKNKFGKGYSLYVNFKKGRIEDGHRYLHELLEGHYEIVNSVATYRIYRIAREHVVVSKLLREIESHKDDNGIDDWGLSQTSLEEVFLSICREEEEDEAPK